MTKCSYYKKYKGIKAPTCHGGKGCQGCKLKRLAYLTNKGY